jgi:thiaminase/transcriptional activator TenA
MLHDTLWRASADLAEACLHHPFVTGLRTGTLERAAFERYVGQDSFYLRVFFRSYALAAGKVERLEHMQLLHELLGGALDEMRMHERSAGELGIDLARVRPLEPTRTYVDFLLDLAWRHNLDEQMAGMTPCMRLYAYLGRRLAEEGVPGSDHPYGSWIRTYSAADFQRLADRIDAFLDEVAADSAAVRAAYRFAMRCEYDFFDAAWRG